MPSIARLEANTTSKINWFGAVDFVLTDMYSMEFRIVDISGGLPGSQIFPDSGWEDVSAAPGKFATGSYYAYDNAHGYGWTPPADASLGTHRVFWRWKKTVSDAYQEGAEDIEVTAEVVALTAAWLTIQDLYNLIGSQRVLGLFDDAMSGSLGSASTQLQAILLAAEGEAYSRMMRGWSKAMVEALAGADIAFRNHTAWVALEFASERRPAFASDDGKGQFWAQYERAISHFDQLGKGRLRSGGEGTAGKSANIGGNLRPTTTAKTAAAFTFAPSERNPNGSGGY